MKLVLKAIYVCVTAGNRWGKGYTASEAKKNAGLTNSATRKAIEHYVQAAVFNSEGMTDEEFNNLHDCVTANSIDGSPKYYDQDRTEEDTVMIKKYHVGWLMVEKNIKETKK
jgi:hypothetical protein